MCLWLMLPPGLARQGDTLYTLISDPEEEQTPALERVLSLLRRRGPLRGRQIEHALPQKNWQSAVNGLVKRGFVQKEPIFLPPEVKPKIIRTVQLAIPPERVAAVAPRLGRESQRANVLEVLLATRDRRLSLDTICLVVDCVETVVKNLEKEGAVRIDPKETWVELALPRRRDRAHLEADRENQTKAQRSQHDALETLLKAGRPLPAADLNRDAVSKLVKTGTVSRRTASAEAQLLLTPDETQQRIVDLRGGQPYLDILNFLAESGEAVAVKEVHDKTGADSAKLNRLAEEGLVVLGEAETWRDPLVDRDFVPTVAPPLTAAQTRVWEEVRRHMDQMQWAEVAPESSGVFLLHGVTGSGKTEIYMRAVERALAQGRQAIVMVPEISLTPQTVRRFAARFPGRVSIIHSGLSQGERYDVWRRARSGEIHVIVGARSALFAPLPDIGLIILDEEHDDSYKQSPPIQPPYYHARDTAIELMRFMRGTVLLGSATPSVITYARAEAGLYHLLRLPDRIIAHRERIAEQTRRLNAPTARYMPTDASEAVSADLPLVHLVDMRQELRAGNRSIFSRALRTALNEVLARGEQGIFFLNRRGTATFIMCRDCGYIAMCPRCNTPLTYHGPRERLLCHYCGYTRAQLTVCPDCGSTRIKHFGQGTELIEEAVRAEFPTARVIRWDRDTATGREAHEIILRHFSEGHADILVGTQMIAKGLDLPQVTLVGIISADTALGLPDYRAGERTFQLLTQVAGRAGRGALGGRVVMQSYLPEHYAVQAAAEHNYMAFYQQELAYRQAQLYPPFRRLARLLFQYPTVVQAEQEAHRAAEIIQERLDHERTCRHRDHRSDALFFRQAK